MGSKKRNIGFLILLLIAVVGSLYFGMMQEKQSSPPLIPSSSHETRSFSSFVGAWNNKVSVYELSEKHLLPYADSDGILRILQNYTEQFLSPNPPELQQELKTISELYPKSLFDFYARFKTSTYQPMSIQWDAMYTSIQLHDIVMKITQEKDFDEAIKKLLASSDPCAFFFIYKYDLWKQGLSRNFQKCSNTLADAHEFPTIRSLIR